MDHKIGDLAAPTWWSRPGQKELSNVPLNGFKAFDVSTDFSFKPRPCFFCFLSLNWRSFARIKSTPALSQVQHPSCFVFWYFGRVPMQEVKLHHLERIRIADPRSENKTLQLRYCVWLSHIHLEFHSLNISLIVVVIRLSLESCLFRISMTKVDWAKHSNSGVSSKMIKI